MDRTRLGKSLDTLNPQLISGSDFLDHHPVYLCCEICGDQMGLSFLGSGKKGDSKFLKMFGTPYEFHFRNSIPSGVCLRCQSHLSRGLSAVFSPDGRSVLISPDMVKNNSLDPGSVISITSKKMDKILKCLKQGKSKLTI